MLKPAPPSPDNGTLTIGRIFGTPLVVKGLSWLPLTWLGVGALLTRLAGREHPQWSLRQRLWAGALTTLAVLGPEWGHNLAHAFAARRVGRPMDALRITWGMPLVIYHNPEDPSVSPRQHILRSLGGPLFNALLLPFTLLAQALSRPNSPARRAARAASGMTAFLATLSLLPIPGIDGAPVLKWWLVQHGRTPTQADQAVLRANRVTGAGLALASATAIRRRFFTGTIAGLFAALSLAVGFGLLKEK